jgi:fructose transport system substrate-binding protein
MGMEFKDLRWASRTAALGATLALAVGAVAGCGSDDEDGGGGAEGGGDGGGEEVRVGLITKTDTNPFFVKMKEGAQSKAQELGVDLQSFAGKKDGDNESQVAAIESLIGAGAKGILITPSNSSAIVPSVDKARQAELLVIALDTQLEPADAADATFATDNFKAGQLIGQWAKGTFEAAGREARIAMLDLSPEQVTVDVQRDQGFLEGFGIDVGDPNRIGDESDPRIVGHDVTDGAEEGGRTAMENLLQKDPQINLVYTINEPAAAGAYEAIKAAGKQDDITIVSVDGGCPGVENVEKGVIGATSQQYPLKMAEMGVQAVADFAETGEKPEPPPGKDFVDTGVTLITDEPVDGVESEDSAFGLENCWG